MTWQAWLTLAVLLLMLYTLMRSLLPPDVAFMGGLVIVVAAGVIDPQDAFAGLSNPGLITVGALFVVAAGLRETGALHLLMARVLGSQTTLAMALARMIYPAAALSAFMNNTPIVAMLMPEVLTWCRRRRISASRMLIPLSYATMLGGMCTLIGSSTNLVVNGMMTDAGMTAMTLFELGRVGLIAAVAGTIFLMAFGWRLLPDRKELMDQLVETRREYIVEILVQPNCPLIGQSIQQAGLRQLPGLFLIEIDRGGAILAPVGPTEKLQAEDRLVFTGLVQTIVDLQRIPGLTPAGESHYQMSREDRRQRRLCEAVVSSSFPELGKTVRTSDFRTRYDAVVVAVHRNGERLRRKVGDIVLQPGDTLLLQAGDHFERTFRSSTDFYLVSEVEDSAPVRHERAGMAIGVLLLLIAMLTFNVFPVAVAALTASALMVLCRCTPIGVARRSVDWQVLVVIAAALGFGQAIRASGLAAIVADVIVDWGYRIAGPVGVLAGIYLLTSLLTELVSNVSAAVIVFPIAMAAARLVGLDDPRPFAIAIAVAASASFATPIGYQTNLMIYGPGGYRFTDFLRIGVILNLLIMIIAIMVIPRVWPLT